MTHSADQVESLLKRVERQGWKWSAARGGLWNEERNLLITPEKIREELEAALTSGFVEAVIAGAESHPRREGSVPGWVPPPLPRNGSPPEKCRSDDAGASPVEPAQQDVRVAGKRWGTGTAEVVAAQRLKEARILAQLPVKPFLVQAQGS